MVIKKHQLGWLALFVPLLGYIYWLTEIPNSIIFFGTNFIVMALSFWGMMAYPNRLYSLSKMVFIFIFFFFGIIPLVNEVNDTVFYSGGQISLFSKIVTNILIIIGIISFMIGERIRLIFFESFIKKIFYVNPGKSRLWLVFGVYFIVLFLILYLLNFNFVHLLFRGVVEDLYGAANDGGIALSQIEYLIFKNVIRPMPIIFLFVFYYVYLMNNKSSTNKDRFILSKYMVALVFVLSVFFLSPTSVSRYMVAALYIPFVIIFTKAWDAPYRMQTTMLGALIILMPILDIFRNFNPENIKLSIGLHYLNQEHFDAYQNFTRVVDVDFITYGYQLMGAIFFFVPRSLWEEKPIGSGAALAQLQEYHFANISMPFLGEGYVNFGVLGVLFFMFFLGLLVGNFDKLAWKIMKTTKHHIILYYYYIVFGILFFLLRGDLLSSFAYFVGITISFLLVVYLFKFSSIRFKL